MSAKNEPRGPTSVEAYRNPETDETRFLFECKPGRFVVFKFMPSERFSVKFWVADKEAVTSRWNTKLVPSLQPSPNQRRRIREWRISAITAISSLEI